MNLLRRIGFTAAALLPVALSLFGCSSAQAQSGATAADAGQTEDAGVQPLACNDDGATDMTGTWAAIGRFALGLQSQTGGIVTMCPSGQIAHATLIFLMRVEPGNAQTSLNVTATPCSLELPIVTAVVGDCRPEANNLLAVEIPLPPQLIARFPEIPLETVGATLSSQAAGSSLFVDRFHFTWGARNSASNMPAWMIGQPGCGLGDFAPGRTDVCESSCVDDCAALTDDDADGYPAVTLQVCGRTQDDIASKVPCRAQTPTEPGITLQGLLRMVLHTELQLDGTALSSCEAVGQFASLTTYSVIGADAYLASTSISVASALQSLPVFEALAKESVFRMIRVDGKHGAPDWGIVAASPSQACATVLHKQNDLR